MRNLIGAIGSNLSGMRSLRSPPAAALGIVRSLRATGGAASLSAHLQAETLEQPRIVLGVDPDTRGAFALLSLEGTTTADLAVGALEDGAGCWDGGVQAIVRDTPSKEVRISSKQKQTPRALAPSPVTAVIQHGERASPHVQVNFGGVKIALRRRIDVAALAAQLRSLNLPAGTVAFLEQARLPSKSICKTTEAPELLSLSRRRRCH